MGGLSMVVVFGNVDKSVLVICVDSVLCLCDSFY